ncbi:MAG TPA: LamG domain-containing protein [Verrucomicrobiae bacterium]|jgi:hypothetical protein
MKSSSLLSRLCALLLLGVFPAAATVTPIAWWRLGENDPGAANGVAATATTNQMGGMMNLVGNPVYTTNVSAAAAIGDGSALGLKFASTNYGTNAIVSTLTNNFGIELWVNPATSNTTACLAYNGTTGGAGSSGWGLYMVGGQFNGLIGGLVLIGSAPATTNVWTHLALVRNNGTTTFYVNGVSNDMTLIQPITPSGRFAIAAQPQSLTNEFFNGSLDEVRVFSFAPGAFTTNDLLLSPHIVINANDSGTGSLRSLVAGAASNAVITFATNLSGQTITLTSGQITLNNNVTIDGSSLASPVQISGNNSSRIFYVTNGVMVTNNSLIITHGYVVGANGNFATDGNYNGGDDIGGGIYNAGTLTLNNCTVTNNTVVGGAGGANSPIAYNGGNGFGGGIYNNGTLTLNNSTVAGSTANGGGGSDGAGMDGGGDGGAGGAGDGGGIYNGGMLTLNGSTVAGSTANGGGGGNGGIAAPSIFVINGGNGGSGGNSGGGGIYNGGTLILNNSTLAGSTANGGSGGSGGDDLGSGNGGNGGNGGSGGGGGIYNGGTLMLNNSTLAGSTANGGGGGGVGVGDVNGDGGANGSGTGGGICNAATLNLTNSIICSNTATVSPNLSGIISSQANNLVDTNALLAPLGNYGGPTQTMPPLPGSPAIDAGSDSVTNSLTIDQRGYPRLIGAHVDIGAVEGVYVTNWAGPGRLTGSRSVNHGAGGFQFNFTNYPDMSNTFTVWASTNVALPFNQWSNLGPVVDSPPGSGQYQFTDSSATNKIQRFYFISSP